MTVIFLHVQKNDRHFCARALETPEAGGHIPNPPAVRPPKISARALV